MRTSAELPARRDRMFRLLVPALRGGALSLPAALCVVAVVFAVLLRLPSLFEPHWYGDEGQFAAIAHDIRHGQTLYRDAWDLKPPFIFLTYAAVQAFAGTGIFPLHLAGLFALIATQVTLMLAVRTIAGPRRAWIAGVVIAFLLGTPILEGNLALTETFMVVPVSLAVLAVVRLQAGERDRDLWWYAAAGALIAIGANFKQVAIWDGLALGLVIATRGERPLRALAAYAAGAALPQVLVVGWFLGTGSFAGYFDAVAGKLPLYAGLAPDPGPFYTIARFIPAAVAGTWLVGLRLRGNRPPLAAIGPLWLAFALAGATSSSWPFPHYLQQLVPPLALTVATLPQVQLVDVTATKVVVGIAGLVLSLAVLVNQFEPAFRSREQVQPLPYYSAAWDRVTGRRSKTEYVLSFDGRVFTIDNIASAIRQQEPSPSAKLFVWGELAWLYPLTGMTNAGRYYTTLLAVGIPDAREEIIARLLANPPEFLVISADSDAVFEQLESFARDHYLLTDQADDWRLFRLRAAHPPG